LIVAALSACRVQSDVNRFNNLPAQVSGQTFFIFPLDSQKGSAEFDQHSRTVATHLQKQGLRPAADLTKADYAVLFNYGISGSRVETGGLPIFGQTGGGTSFQSGTVTAFGPRGTATGTYSGTTYTAPTYGVVGMMPYLDEVHSRFLLLKMIDLKRSTQNNLVAAYEAQVTSSGSSSSFAPVAPCMFDALFKNFGKSGSERVTLDMSICGK
jgi:hypothetical protein